MSKKMYLMCKYGTHDREIIAASNCWKKLETLAQSFGVHSWTVRTNPQDPVIRRNDDDTIRIFEVLTII